MSTQSVNKNFCVDIDCGIDCLSRRFRHSNEAYFQILCTRRIWLLLLTLLFLFECYYNVAIFQTRKGVIARNWDLDTATNTNILNGTTNESVLHYKYPLINSLEVSMDFKKEYNSSYYWFISMKNLFKNIGEEDTVRYANNTPICRLNETSLGPIVVNKTEVLLEWVERQHSDVKLGGYHAPAHCRAAHRVAVIVPYRDRRKNLLIFLRYLHPILKKQLLEYRVFVIEQYGGTEQFNKGTLYNIAFLETQRFGTWNCLIFHDVDLIPEDERISYSCQEHPTHMAAAVESFYYILPYRTIFGGVTTLTPFQYESVNGYSNLYWNWGAEDDDMYSRRMLLRLSKIRQQSEGLRSTKYEVIKITQEKLYTHILADVNPTKIKIYLKTLLNHITYLYGKSIIFGEYDMKQQY